MQIVKTFFQVVVQLFFKVYFSIFGKPQLNASMRKTLSLYKNGDFSQTFQLIRSWDAPYEIIDELMPRSGVIVDLGCGDGLLANYIAISRSRTKVLGIDVNKDRIGDAPKGIVNTKFIYGDILKKDIPKADVILIIHVLHHLSSKKDQEMILRACKTKLKRHGKLLIAEVSEKPFLKYVFSWFTDRITVPILFEGRVYNPNVFFRRVEDWGELFDKLGFEYKTIEAHKGKPFSHVVFECRKSS